MAVLWRCYGVLWGCNQQTYPRNKRKKPVKTAVHLGVFKPKKPKNVDSVVMLCFLGILVFEKKLWKILFSRFLII